MIRVENDAIYIARGNSGTIDLIISDEVGVSYQLEKGDALVLGVKKNCDDEEVLIKKTKYTENIFNGASNIYIYTFAIDPNDTSALDFGNYRYDITLTYKNGAVDTIVRNQLFKICRTVNT